MKQYVPKVPAVPSLYSARSEIKREPKKIRVNDNFV